MKVFWCNFLAYNFSKISAYKMFMKMTTGLQRKCRQEDEKDDQVGVNVDLWGQRVVNLQVSTPGANLINLLGAYLGA